VTDSILSLDFETASDIDLKARGAYVYAMDPSTEVLMMSWAFDDEPVQVWEPNAEPFPQRIVNHIRAGGIIDACNAQFERLIFWYVLCPDFDIYEPALEQFHCTAARARAHGLPGKLADMCRALDLPVQKMAEGTRLINTYCCKYRDDYVPFSQAPPEDRALFLEYCRIDTVTERMAANSLRELTDKEWAEYHANERINDRGVPIDPALATAALEYAEDVRQDIDKRIAVLTGGKVKNARARKTRDEWVLPQLGDNKELTNILTKVRTEKDPETGERVEKRTISFEEARRQALALHPECPDPVREYLELLEEAGGATISKYRAMLNRNIDGRVHGVLMFNGAGQTGRFSSTGAQFHNLLRDGFDDPEPVIADLIEGYELDDVTKTLAKLVRPTVYRPEGLSWFDWSAIEGRVCPWLSASYHGERKLDLFREGLDVYVDTASKTFHIPYDEVSKDFRQVGKVMELSLQFLGGVGALKAMARNYGLHISTPDAERYRDAWRHQNPWAREFGDALDEAAMNALLSPGNWHEAGRIQFAYDGRAWLWMELPSGRLLAYYQPRIEEVETPWGDLRWAVTCLWGAGKAKVGEPWPRRAMHGGVWIENATQGTAACILRDALLECDRLDVPVVLDVHDEIIAEGHCVEQLGEIMLRQLPWASGLPLTGEGDSGPRYGK